MALPDKDTGLGTLDTLAEPLLPAEAAPIPDLEMLFPKKAIATRTQLLQLVLLAASLKLLTQMTPAAPPGAPQRTLHRNPLTISSLLRTALRDFQLFIQAPVLTLVLTLRQLEVEIGQHSPFGDAILNDNNGTTTLDYLALQRELRSVAPPPPTTGTAPPDLPRQLFSQPLETALTTAQDPQASLSKIRPRQPLDDTQIAENLTLNALKKLLMLPLPMVSHGGVKRAQLTPLATATAPQMTPAQPNNNAALMPGLRTTTPAPYQPATVDLSLFPLLTRQSSLSRLETPVAPEPEPAATPRNQLTILSVLSQQQSRFPANQPPPAQVAAGTGAGNRPPSVVLTLPRRDYHAQQAQHLNKQMKPLLQGTQLAPNAATVATSTSNNSTTNGSKVLTPSRAANPYFSQGTPVQRLVLVPLRQLQLIQGLRLPMYVPAVLRVTQNPMIPTPDSDDYLPSHPLLLPELVVLLKPSTPLIPSTPLQGPQSRSYDDIMRAPPTRKHWLKDELVDKCMIELCPRTFNFFERRHHCRKCGGIFCKEHTLHLLYINHLAQFTTGGRGTLLKVCDMCIDEYLQFIVAEFGPLLVPTVTPSTSNNGGAATPRYRQPLLATPEEQQDPNKPLAATHRPVINGKLITTKEAAAAAGCGHFDDQAPRDQLVGLVPANWSWSSF